MLSEIMALHNIVKHNVKGKSNSNIMDLENLSSHEFQFALSQNNYISPMEEISPINICEDARINITVPDTCPACGAQCLLYIGGVRPASRFIHRYLPVLYCQHCGTLCTPHNVELHLHDPSLAWHLSVETRNRNAARKLFAEVQAYHTRPIQRVVEIGCGPGWLLSELPLNVSSVGYETNPYCAAYGKILGLDIRCEMFDVNTEAQFDILFCLSVIEHIEKPENVLFSISEQCKKNNAAACLFVPFFSDSFINYIHNTFERSPQNPFWAVPAHVVYYTITGFYSLLKRFGATNFQQCHTNGLWGAILCTFSNNT